MHQLAAIYQNNGYRHILCEIFILDNAYSLKILFLRVDSQARQDLLCESACASLCPHLAFLILKLLQGQILRTLIAAS